MALPPLPTKVNLDSQDDDPKNARGELATNVDRAVALQGALGALATLSVGDGLQMSGTNLKVNITASDDVDIDLGEIT